MANKLTTTSKNIRKAIHIPRRNSKTAQDAAGYHIDYLSESLGRAIRYGNLDASVSIALQGILHGYATGRFNGTTHMTIRQMSLYDFAGLLAEVSVNAGTIDAAYQYARNKFAEAV